MLDGEDIHSYHYQVNYETYDSWMDRMNEDQECVLCKVEQDCSKDRQLKHKMDDYKGIAYFVSNLMPTIGCKTRSREAIQYALIECESD